MPLGHLLDQWEIYKQFEGMSRSNIEVHIEEIIPYGI